MSQHAKKVIAGIYQPIYPRRAYGRRTGSALLVEDFAAYTITAREAPPRIPRVRVPMPHGGARLIMLCPTCSRWVTRLYNLYNLLNLEDPADPIYQVGFACRACLGLHYRSEYQGRRPEAALERQDELLEAALGATSPEAHERRLERYQQACETAQQRRDRFSARQDIARALATTLALLRAEARDQRENGAKDVQKRTKQASFAPKPATHNTLIMAECLAALRERYAALSPARRHAKVA